MHDYGLWNWDGTLDRIHPPTSSAARKPRAKPAPRPATVIASDSHGFDAGKLIKGKKPCYTQGLLLHGIVTAADVQDRDGGLALLATLFGLFPFLGKLFADRPIGPGLSPRPGGIARRPRSKRSD